MQKLVTKQGAREHRVHDRAQTPYQRLCASGVLAASSRDALEVQYQGLNPPLLPRDLDAELDCLWTLAAPDPLRPSSKSAPERSQAMVSVNIPE